MSHQSFAEKYGMASHSNEAKPLAAQPAVFRMTRRSMYCIKWVAFGAVPQLKDERGGRNSSANLTSSIFNPPRNIAGDVRIEEIAS